MSTQPVIAAPRKWVSSHKMWSLDSSLTPRDISAALRRKIRQQPRTDSKVKHRWEFLVDGVECAIWDYYGTRWSAYGPREAFEKLGLTVF